MTENSKSPDLTRTIRSFVRRAGRLTPGQERAMESLWPVFGLEYSPEPLDLDDIFGRTADRILEIGFGNGETLVEQAANHRDRDYIGIEVHVPGVGHCLLHAEKAELQNLRLIGHDAIDVLRQQIPEASLARVNLYFPDPWPKKRHHKRRIVKPSFLALVAGKLCDGGALHIATDWANYAEHIDEAVEASGLYHVAERRVHDGENALDRPMTKFERRGLGKGHRIFDWRLVRN
jgi:tRNA (guanine-N7-)-methyltransferase